MTTATNIPRELLPHERAQFEAGILREVTHRNSRHRWFEATLQSSRGACDEECVFVYRHMGDIELEYLVEHGTLPCTQPYQTVVEGEQGYRYCRKYFQGTKRVDTEVRCIVEFCMRKRVVEMLFRTFHKAEDGCISTGLGEKAGKTLNVFNDELRSGRSTWTKVLVKRPLREKRR